MRRAIPVPSDGPGGKKGLDPVRRIFWRVSRISAREKGGAEKEGGSTPKTNNNISTEEEKADMRQNERRKGGIVAVRGRGSGRIAKSDSFSTSPKLYTPNEGFNSQMYFYVIWSKLILILIRKKRVYKGTAKKKLNYPI